MQLPSFATFLLLPSALSQCVAAASFIKPRATVCNNSPLLCDQQYNDITHLGAHDSPFVKNATNGYTDSGNQYYNSTEQLSAGVRLLSAQIHYVSQTNSFHLCHSSCDLYDAGTVESWLASIKGWLDDNPNDVVTLLLVNSDNMSAAQLAAAYQSAGLTTYTYTPSFSAATTAWPTLSSMIASNERVVTFVPQLTFDAAAPYLLNEWTYIFENAYNVVQPDNSTSCAGNFSCALNRPTTSSSAAAAISSGMMPLMNHLLYQDFSFGIQAPVPTCAVTNNAPSTTEDGALGAAAAECESTWGRKPWGILTDFVNIGPAIETVDALNGVSSDDVVGRANISSTPPNTSGATMSVAWSWSSWMLVTAVVTATALVN